MKRYENKKERRTATAQKTGSRKTGKAESYPVHQRQMWLGMMQRVLQSSCLAESVDKLIRQNWFQKVRATKLDNRLVNLEILTDDEHISRNYLEVQEMVRSYRLKLIGWTVGRVRCIEMHCSLWMHLQPNLNGWWEWIQVKNNTSFYLVDGTYPNT